MLKIKDFERGGLRGMWVEKSLEKSGELLRLKLISKRVTRARNYSKKKNYAQRYPGKPRKKKKPITLVWKAQISVSTSDGGLADPCKEGRRGRLQCVK